VKTLADAAGRNVVLVFYLGRECPKCMEQLIKLRERIKDFEAAGAVVWAVSSDPPERSAEQHEDRPAGYLLLSDPDHETARRFKAYDDFEDMELHAVVLVDRRGRVQWGRYGGDPFMDLDFLLAELRRMNGSESALPTATASTTP
jgi:peroxiredoxin